MLRIGVAQMCSGTDPGANLDDMARLANDTAGAGARYLLTPEMSVVFAEDRDRLADVAEPFEGNRSLARCAQIAADSGIYLHVGSLPIALDDGRFANRSVIYGPEGSLVARYDKIHLFDADLPGEKSYRESATYAGGDRVVLADVAGHSVGMTICYDVRFAHLYADLALEGADILAVPAAFTVPTGQAHWEILLRARAVETGCYVLAAAQGGIHGNGRQTYGHSMIVDPWGRVVAEREADTPGLLFAEIDRQAVAGARSRVPALANRRAYSISGDAATAARTEMRNMKP